MWILGFYRLYVALVAGCAFYLLATRSVWFSLFVTVVVRTLWFVGENTLREIRIRHYLRQHIHEFKQQFGPYGIRIANKAEKDGRIRRSLAEVFEPNCAKLEKTIEQLEVMDTLFKAGMRPQGDEFLLHDLKLKYGKYRLKKLRQS